jgi:hypothetical protein
MDLYMYVHVHGQYIDVHLHVHVQKCSLHLYVVNFRFVRFSQNFLTKFRRNKTKDGRNFVFSFGKTIVLKSLSYPNSQLILRYGLLRGTYLYGQVTKDGIGLTLLFLYEHNLASLSL